LANGQRAANGTATQLVLYEKNAASAAKIIKNGFNDKLFQNVENINNLKKIWDRLKKVCTQIG